MPILDRLTSYFPLKDREESKTPEKSKVLHNGVSAEYSSLQKKAQATPYIDLSKTETTAIQWRTNAPILTWCWKLTGWCHSLMSSPS